MYQGIINSVGVCCGVRILAGLCQNSVLSLKIGDLFENGSCPAIGFDHLLHELPIFFFLSLVLLFDLVELMLDVAELLLVVSILWVGYGVFAWGMVV